jgi:uncharacterized protein (DUF305 family)
MINRYVGLATALAVLLAGACAPAATRTSGPSETDLAAAALADSVRRSYTQADIDFMAGMIHHHAQALVMARMAPTHGASEPLGIMAARIINAQNDEIALMQRWLEDRGEPASDTDSDMGMMMPGMLTDEQLAALDAARGTEFDRLFLTYMIQHHQGAVTMVSELFATDGAAQEQTVFKLASDIEADQASEIARMQSMLREILFEPDESP